ncbi:MAG: VIT and VWA domain-containing protein [Deltaproteobacteria bacterium]|jgi:Ca-activated chloride channel family protein|nr:VIT and VWA domain-containing protein [Deltaproteobacteria bacterium]
MSTDHLSVANPNMFSREGESLALKSVQALGRLEGLSLEMTLVQRYQNATDKNLEIVYTFPLPLGSELLEVQATIGEKTLKAVVQEKNEATRIYEDSIDKGDSAILIELGRDGLYTVNLGNVLAKEEVTVEVQFAQILGYDGDRIRLTLPTVIAPKYYGDPQKAGGLEPHQTPEFNRLAEYPFSLQIDLLGEISQALISSPSHQIRLERGEGETEGREEKKVTVILDSQAFLDREFILLLEKLPSLSSAVTVDDGDEKVIVASFAPRLPEYAEPLTLKILLDCSGSMGGGNIDLAKKALLALLRLLGPQDHVSLTRFGSRVEHTLKKLTPLTEPTRQQLEKIITRINADLGGTEMGPALAAVFSEITPAKVLLITDGAVWGVDDILATGLKSGQRVFTIGIGLAPGAEVISKLATGTRGAMERLSPRENVTLAMTNILGKLKTPTATQAQVDWGKKPLWEVPVSPCLYNGVTVHAMAGFQELPSSPPTLSWVQAGQKYEARAESLVPSRLTFLARLAGARRLQTARNEEVAGQLALKYRLVSPRTSMILVLARDEDKAKQLPILHQVPQMVVDSNSHFLHGRVIGGSVGIMALSLFNPFDFFLGRSSSFPRTRDSGPGFLKPSSLARLSLISDDPLAILNQAGQAGDWDSGRVALERSAHWVDLKKALDLMAPNEGQGLTEDTLLALILEWLANHSAASVKLSRQAQRLLRQRIGSTTEDQKKRVFQALEQIWP